MPSITPLPIPPSRDRLDTFDQDADAFLDALPTFVGETNTLAASLGTLAAPGALAIPYTFSSSITDADPGPGTLRLNNASESSANRLMLDDVSSAGDNWRSVISSFAAATGADKGQIRIAKVGEPTKWLVFTVTALTSNSGYSTVDIAPLGASGAAPFVNGDAVLMFFTRTGDQGATGTAPAITAQQIRDALGTLPVSTGGTGATTALQARNNLDVLSSGQVVRLNLETQSAGTRLTSGAPPSIATITGAAQNDNVAFIVSNGGNTSASTVIQFLRGGQYGAFFGLDTDNQWKVGGYSMGAVAYRIWHEGNFNPSPSAAWCGAGFSGNIAGPSLNISGNAGVNGTVYCGDLVATSDEALKSDWEVVDHEQFVLGLASTERAGRFKWNSDGRLDLGVGAQSVQRYAPECVRRGDDEVLRINQGALSTLGVVALARYVLDLEQRLTSLAAATGAL